MLVPENCAGQPLSPRERQCLVLTACGRTAKEIAAILDLGYGTVRNYLDQARRKLDAVNLVQAVAAIAFATLARRTLVPENCAGRPLSPRERQCLALAACGRTAEEIAAILDLGYGTVRIHLDQARRKLDAVNLVQAVAVAIAFATLAPSRSAGFLRPERVDHNHPIRPGVGQRDGSRRISADCLAAFGERRESAEGWPEKAGAAAGLAAH
jgi:DNA-binding CsgD family transcriptional regulator